MGLLGHYIGVMQKLKPWNLIRKQQSLSTYGTVIIPIPCIKEMIAIGE